MNGKTVGSRYIDRETSNFLSDLKARKLPMLLSRLNEISGGREKMCLVSGSLRRILKFLRITFLTARFCGW